MIVTDQYAPMVGGVPTVTRELARGLSERGHAVAVIAPGPSVRGGPAAGRQAIAAFAPDVLPLHSPLTLGLAASAAARRRGIPVIYTNHYLPLNVWPALAHARAGGGRLGDR